MSWWQFLQTYGFSPVWIHHVSLQVASYARKCFCYIPYTAWGFSSVWVPHVFLSGYHIGTKNVLWHSLHTWYFSPVWVLMWVFRVARYRECLVTVLYKHKVSLQYESSCVSSGCHIQKMICHSHCIYEASPQCASSCESSGCHIGIMFCHSACTHEASLLVWILKCVSSDWPYRKNVLITVHYKYEASPQCGSLCESSDY